MQSPNEIFFKTLGLLSATLAVLAVWVVAVSAYPWFDWHTIVAMIIAAMGMGFGIILLYFGYQAGKTYRQGASWADPKTTSV